MNGSNADLINGGAQRGNNLFHSFIEFNINDGQRVYFGNPSGVQNILTRVTGANASNILGTLGVNGIANLFLINPNGIVFGNNASLDIRGSFVGTTANAVQFENQGIFSATNPQAPPLLVVNPSALLFNQINQNSTITNQSQAFAGSNPSGGDSFGLRVPDGKSLLLVGGNVLMNGGALRAYSGRVELGGLAAPGTVNLLSDGNNLSLVFPGNSALSDVLLTNEASIRVEGSVGGSITINSHNLDVLEGSILSAGIGIGLGTVDSQAGDITLNAAEKIQVGQSSQIQNAVAPFATGKSGNINITTGSLYFTDGAGLLTSSFGQGDAGDVTVRAIDVVSLTGANTIIASNLESGSVGKGGNVNINAANLFISDGAQLQTFIRQALETQPAAQGNAGNVNITVTGTVDIVGKQGIFLSAIVSEADTGTLGNGGNITIDAGDFLLRDGAQLSASTFAQGNGGNITVHAKNSVFLANSGIFSIVQPAGVGKGGNININTASLKLTDGAQLSTSTFGQGNAGIIDVTAGQIALLKASGILASTDSQNNGGNVIVNTNQLSLQDGSFISTAALSNSTATGGNITINATKSVAIAGISEDNDASGLFAQTQGAGRAGDIQVTTKRLTVRDGGTISGETNGSGKAGNLTIDASELVEVIGGAPNNQFVSGISVQVEENVSGNAGNLTINTKRLVVKDGAFIAADTRENSKGNGGQLLINASDSVEVIGTTADGEIPTAISVDGDGTGNAGNLTINTQRLVIKDEAEVAAKNFGSGQPGQIAINAGESVEVIGGKDTLTLINAVAGPDATGNPGDIRINTKRLLLQDGGQIAALTFGKVDAGSIQINATGSVEIIGQVLDSDSLVFPESGILALSAPSTDGFSSRGGDIKIQTGNLNIKNNGQISATAIGVAGDIDITADIVTLDNSGSINAESLSGNGGNINLNSDLLLLRRGAEISTTAGNAQAGGDGGNINIKSTFIVAAPNENTDITANAFTGAGGNINIFTQNIFGIEARPKPSDATNDITASSELGVQGQIAITQPEVQPGQGLIELPTEVIDASTKFSQICPRDPNPKPLAKFVVTGRGSLPPSPLEFLTGTSISIPLATLDKQTATPINGAIIPVSNPSPEIIEAQGWIQTANGIVLIANAPNATPSSRPTATVCPHR
ncbi:MULTISPECIES: filamentous hemagglutinin N-terminal domain-containing protein [unclassified Tolypothrix]|uniref:two-partner secretion domain-containing protein n=1 Tax=unclassified Tolypothrix TaxID=2649714 RepID=UPI0021010619|nr:MULTISPECIES: filamentous hemagglutinin N-terminal domain-containing protein [unclassified Tolypothrix]